MRHTRIRIWLRRCCKIDGIRDGIRRDPTSVEFRKISKTRGRGVKKSLGIRDGSDGIRVLFLSKSREMIRRCGENGAGSETSFKISAIRFCLDRRRVLKPFIRGRRLVAMHFLPGLLQPKNFGLLPWWHASILASPLPQLR